MHDLNLAIKLSDNMLVLDNGNIAAYGSTNEIISSNLLNEVYDMDVTEYMVDSLKHWESFGNYTYKNKLRKVN
jgi:iron complex transport system ATP-binding protein